MPGTREFADDTLQSARNLGTLNRTRKIKGSLNWATGDLDDFYSFSLSGRSSVAISLRKLQDDASLQLLDAKGKAIASSNKSGKQTEQLSRTLEEGTYYIQISQYASTTRYLLKAGATFIPDTDTDTGTDTGTDSGSGSGSGTNSGSNSGGSSTSGNSGNPGTDSNFNVPTRAIPPFDPGSLPATAFDIGNLTEAKAFRDTVGGSDQADVYRLSVTQNSNVAITTNNVSGGDAVTRLIFDINGNGFIDSDDTIGAGNSIKYALGIGTYFVEVKPTNAASIRYDLVFETTAITDLTNPIPDPPIGLGGAQDLGIVSGLVSLKQLVGSTDSADIYKFTLDKVSNFTTLVDSSQQIGDVTMALIYEPKGQENGIANPGELIDGLVVGGDFIGGASIAGGANGTSLSITKTLGAGTYYLAVTQKKLTDNTTYNVNLFVNNTVTGITPTTDPGSTMGTAFTIGELTSDVSYRQFVGSVDDSDFYKFTVSQEKNIIISYNGSPELVALRFGRDLNNNGFFDLSEDKNGNDILDFEDKNLNGILDEGEDLDKNGQLDTEDLNNNGFLDPNEVFEQQLSGDVVYSPLPPFFNGAGSFKEDPRLNGFYTTVPTNIYARLPAGTYYVQVDIQSTTVDLGDGLTRYGSGNALYNLAFALDD